MLKNCITSKVFRAFSRAARHFSIASAALTSFSLSSAQEVDGRTWQRFDSGTTEMLYQISAASKDFVVAAGTDKTLLLYQGGKWNPFPGWEEYAAATTPFGSWVGDYLRLSVTAVSPTEVWVASYGSSDHFVRWNDGAFSTFATGNKQRTTRLNHGAGYIFGARGNAWATTVTPSGKITKQVLSSGTFLLGEVAGFDENNIFAVGSGRIFRSTDSGSEWTGLMLPSYVSGATVRAVGIYDDETAWFGTNTGLLFSWNKANGGFADTPEANLGFDIKGIYAKSAEEIWIVGNGGNLWFYNGSSAFQIDLGTTDNLLSITEADGEIWVSGADGLIYSTIPEPTTSALLLLASLGLWKRHRRSRGLSFIATGSAPTEVQ